SSPTRTPSRPRRSPPLRARSTRVTAPGSRRRCRLSPDEARARLAALGFDDDTVGVLFAHFEAAETSGREGHGFRRIEWLESWSELQADARPSRVVSEPGYERWRGGGALGYLVVDAVVRAQLVDPPEHVRLVVCDDTFPTGMLGYWVRR